jgi:hypothetical protein
MGSSPGSNTVSISLEPNGVTISNIPWTQGMNVQTAMERAYAIPPGITFAIEYFGSTFGYLVLTIDGTTNTSPDYWFLYVNDVLTDTGIDSTTLNAGDAVSFKYEEYNASKHAAPIHAARHAAAQKNTRES